MVFELGLITLPNIEVFPVYSDDDITDRLYHRWTVILLVLLSIIVILVNFVGDPIRCWCPAEFTDSHCNYTEAFCWIKNTYFVPKDDYLPENVPEREDLEIKYYQWVSIILLFLALCFKAPNMFWRMLNTRGGINLEKTVHYCNTNQIGAQREECVQIVGKFLDRWLMTSKRAHYGLVHTVIEKISTCFCFCLGRRNGTYLAGLYLCIKFSYLFVSIGILLLLNKFLAMEYTFYGVELIDNLVKNKEMRESPLFPRVTLCDFQIRRLQNVQRYTIQCVLAINLYNEKIFAFLWFWLVIITFIGLYSYFIWIKRLMVPSRRIGFVRKYFHHIDKKVTKNAKGKFIRDYLATDGVFVLRMLEYNTSEMMVVDVVKALWDRFGDSVLV
ncbi:innexin unc-9-like isoform X2 [Haliotis rufescens]|uniref:innexin unc-9-like isoform X2 n=1 Tax=Haliotis rufescens TaxID=6454 RepID=UPI00201EA17B|nr:innexin unc-9-like isoform X2 [Haliotis rufescens]